MTWRLFWFAIFGTLPIDSFTSIISDTRDCHANMKWMLILNAWHSYQITKHHFQFWIKHGGSQAHYFGFVVCSSCRSFLTRDHLKINVSLSIWHLSVITKSSLGTKDSMAYPYSVTSGEGSGVSNVQIGSFVGERGWKNITRFGIHSNPINDRPWHAVAMNGTEFVYGTSYQVHLRSQFVEAFCNQSQRRHVRSRVLDNMNGRGWTTGLISLT